MAIDYKLPLLTRYNRVGRIVAAPPASGKTTFVNQWGGFFVDGDRIVAANTGWDAVTGDWHTKDDLEKRRIQRRYADDVLRWSNSHPYHLVFIALDIWCFSATDLFAIVLIDEIEHLKRADARAEVDPGRFDIRPGLLEDRAAYVEYYKSIPEDVAPPLFDSFEPIVGMYLHTMPRP